MNAPVYLDYNATAPLYPEVVERMSVVMSAPLNASAVHARGREGRKIIEAARRNVSALVGADPENVIFNSGATEGNNTVLRHFNGRVLVSAIEHPSVLQVRPDAEIIPVKPSGVIDLLALEEALQKEPKAALVSLMLANNETGIIQPAKEVAGLAMRYGAWMHCDAVQAAGKIPVDMTALGIHFMTLSAHKIGGPQGVGALVLGQCGETPMLLAGGGQEKKARAGTENVAGVAGFGLAAEMALKNLADNQLKQANLRDGMERRLCDLYPDIAIHGAAETRLPNTSLFSLPGLKAETLLMALDLAGVCVSNGSACTSGKVEASHVLKAMNVPQAEIVSALRVSLGYGTDSGDIETFLAALKRSVPVDKIQSSSSGG
ncbi:MAG: cysteine desulfurase [Alphaproteobacteria bacterium]|nr:cysteine desulfurase [Alphaproteobacteria bacterium]MCD8520574.1 cysteine desulfurase [Alphaproteobacteria bacterium]MCD8526469.1 cysteine desulfurase [Alphaproteobacteria bacterium]MCD8571682.1 cysteine desulfurase [Alphaproteobacteria bacterium]